jgi:aarF domain-containing kinase
MKRASDVSRVLRGINLVVDQILKNGKSYSPEFERRIERLRFHAIQLSKNIADIRFDEQIYQNNDAKHDYSHSTSSVKVEEEVSSSMNLKDDGIIMKDGKLVEEAPVSSNVGFEHMENMNKAQYLTETAAKAVSSQAEVDLIGFPKDSSSATTAESSSSHSQETVSAENTDIPKSAMKPRAVPSSQIARMWGFGSLAAQMAFGVATESASRLLDGGNTSQSISDRNAERLAEALCRMRGAALKLGQMLSLHDADSLPPALSKALERVRQGADYMPRHQLEEQMVKQLGPSWKENFSEFIDIPIAAASIGQVHRGRLIDGTEVAIKIQYPGVAESIESDLQNLKRLVNMTNILPPGLFIDQIIRVASQELAAECDYLSEAAHQIKYRDLVLADPILSKHVNVPIVYPALSTSRVLTTALVPGISIEKAAAYPQAVRNAIARTTLITTIRELFDWRLVQSDPNYANYLYDDPNRVINMIDFGAAREYNKSFMDGYLKLVWAAANRDKDTLVQVSKDLGFLTGDESIEMIHAHAETGLVVGEPFLKHEAYDFAASNLSGRISRYGGTFLKYRLTAPPTETYSLHRKLAGAFLLCIRLKAKIPCRDILEETYKSYKFEV